MGAVLTGIALIIALGTILVLAFKALKEDKNDHSQDGFDV